MRVTLLVIDLLVALLPTEFRRSFAREIRADFSDRWQDCVASHRGVRRTLHLMALVVGSSANLLAVNIAERVKRPVRLHNTRPTTSSTRDLKRYLPLVPLHPDSLFQDVRFATRGFMKQPGFTLAVVVLLAVGIGANVAMFSALHQALIRPLPYAEPENLVLGRATFDGNINPDMSAYDFFDYRERNQVFESAGLILTSPVTDLTITGGEEPERASSVFVSWDLFPTLGIPAAAGRHFTRADGEPGGPDVIMISGSYWLRRFGGSPDVVGSTILADGTVQTIVGVMPPSFKFVHDVDIWVPMKRGGPRAGSRGWHNWLMVARLRPGVSIEQAQTDMSLISAQLASEYPDTNRDKALLLTRLHAAVAEDYQTTVVLLMGAVGLVLLIACGNVASLLLARGATRRSELCVRAALGASSARLIRQLLTESMVISTAGGALGTALAIWLQRLIRHVIPVDVPGMENLGVSWSTLAFALAVSAATGLLFGVLPAAQAVRVDIVHNVKSGARTTDARGQHFQSGLVVAQVAVSVILLVGSGLLLKSFATLRAVDPGFDTRNLLTTDIRLSSDRYRDEAQRIAFFATLREELQSIPGVTDVAVINQLPIRDPGNNVGVYATDRPPPHPNDRVSAFRRTVLPGYFDAMGIPLLSGRGIDASDLAHAPRVLVINETMARALFPGEDPLGRMVNIGGGIESEVIGVVGDVRLEGLRSRQRAVMYGSYLQQPTLTMRLAIRTAIESTSLTTAVRDAVWNQDGDIPIVGLQGMEEIIARTVWSDKVVALSVALFASAAVLLAALGLYGVLAYYVTRRTHEIGIRVALGAGASDVLLHIVKRGLLLVAVGIGLGLVGAYWSTSLLQQMLFNTSPTDATTFLSVSLVLAVVALVACLVPARKALKVNPVKALAAQ
jgi:putative ABC transport system permease protein